MTSFTTRHIYTFDAFASLATGLVLVGLAGPAADLLGPALGAPLLLGTGVALLPWAAFNFWIGRQPSIPSRAAIGNVVGDGLALLTCAGLPLLAGPALTPVGAVLLLGTALFVAGVLATKLVGLSRRPRFA